MTYIRLGNGAAAPIQLETQRGAVVLSNPNNKLFKAFLNNEQWDAFNDQTWFVTTQQGEKLVGSGGVPTSYQGHSVSLSADGNTLASGGYADNSNQGAVWIFTRSGTLWSQQGTKLIGSGVVGTPYQGFSVSLSADGNTLASGGGGDNSSKGAVWIFTRTGTSWAQQGTKLVGSGTVGTAALGWSVSLSADGNTLAIGGIGDNNSKGAVWIFIRSGTSWAQQGTKLLGADSVGTSQQGISVSLSADGNTLAFGGSTDASNFGAVWIFTRTGTTWAQQGNKLIASDAGEAPEEGGSVSLAANGDLLAFGGKGDSGGVGAVWIFARSGTTWSQQGTKLTVFPPTTFQGVVALSANGNTLGVGAQGTDGYIGAVWVFTRSNGVWTQQGTKMIGSGYISSPYQGSSLALSADGNTLAESGYLDGYSSEGAVWVFV